MKKTIGFLTWSLNAYFVKRVVTGMNSALLGEDIQIVPIEMEAKGAEEYHKFLESLSRRPELDALIYCHLRLNSTHLARFQARGVPVAAVSERMQGIDWVSVDEVRGGWLATRHLLQMGHRQLAIINGPGLSFQAREREQGFLRALKEEGIDLGHNRDVKMLNFAEDEGREAMELLLDMPNPPTGVFVAAGDMAALGVLKALRDRGMEVPTRMSIIGYDNLDFCSFIYPKLTSVNQPLEAMGAWAVNRMKKAMASPRTHQCKGELMEPELIVRESVIKVEARPRPEKARDEAAGRA